ncbi:MAG TPA: hypothetical protein VHE30_26785 [Polyangiaceae bacterium]|nr:hypothetical protein [Polyangiaceae bacterium]
METCILEIGVERARLVCGALDRAGNFTTRTLETATLGAGVTVDEVGGIGRTEGAEAIAKLGRLVELGRAHAPASDLHVIAVDSLGGASNARAFVRGVERRLGLAVTVLSPRETVRLAYAAARAEAPSVSGQAIVAHLGDTAVDFASGTRATLDVEATVSIGIERLLRAYETGPDPLLPEDAGALFSLVRLTAGPAAKRLRAWGAESFLVASEHVASLRVAASAFGFVDTRTQSIDRLSLHAFASEALNATSVDFARSGITRRRARSIGATAVVVDALSDLLGARQVRLAATGPAEGAALEILARPLDRLAAGAESRGRY